MTLSHRPSSCMALAGRGDADGGRRHDQLHVRVLVDQRQRLVVAVLGLVVAVDDVEQLQLGVLRILQRLLHRRDPGVLVGGIRRGGEDGELAAVGAQDAQRHVGHHHADLVEVDLGDEDLLAFTGRDRASPRSRP